MPQMFSRASDYIKTNPQLHMDFKRIIAEGNLVAVHSHLKPNPQDRGMAVVDIFRVEGWQAGGALGRNPARSNTSSKQKWHVLNVTFHADDWFTHNVSHRIRHFEW